MLKGPFRPNGLSAGKLRIHPPDVIGKYAPDSIIGKAPLGCVGYLGQGSSWALLCFALAEVGSGAPAPAAEAAAGGGLGAPLLDKSGHKALPPRRAAKEPERAREPLFGVSPKP